MLINIIHVKLCWIMSNHVTSCQSMSFIPNHVKSGYSWHHSCLSCYHSCSVVIKCVLIGILDKVGWSGGVKKCFQAPPPPPSEQQLRINPRVPDMQTPLIVCSIGSPCKRLDILDAACMLARDRPPVRHGTSARTPRKCSTTNIRCTDTCRDNTVHLRQPATPLL
jgi:hypothetical protein